MVPKIRWIPKLVQSIISPFLTIMKAHSPPNQKALMTAYCITGDVAVTWGRCEEQRAQQSCLYNQQHMRRHKWDMLAAREFNTLVWFHHLIESFAKQSVSTYHIASSANSNRISTVTWADRSSRPGKHTQSSTGEWESRKGAWNGRLCSNPGQVAVSKLFESPGVSVPWLLNGV